MGGGNKAQRNASAEKGRGLLKSVLWRWEAVNVYGDEYEKGEKKALF